jgi:hypothetical protein
MLGKCVVHVGILVTTRVAFHTGVELGNCTGWFHTAQVC